MPIFFGVANSRLAQKLAALAERNVAFGCAMPIERRRMCSCGCAGNGDGADPEEMAAHFAFDHPKVKRALQSLNREARRKREVFAARAALRRTEPVVLAQAPDASGVLQEIERRVERRLEDFISHSRIFANLNVMPPESRQAAEQNEREKAAAARQRKHEEAEQRRADDDEAERVLSPEELSFARKLLLAPSDFLKAKRRRNGV